MTTTTTIGQLVAELFATYEHQLHDQKLAALATEAKVHTLRRVSRRIAPRHPAVTA